MHGNKEITKVKRPSLSTIATNGRNQKHNIYPSVRNKAVKWEIKLVPEYMYKYEELGLSLVLWQETRGGVLEETSVQIQWASDFEKVRRNEFLPALLLPIKTRPSVTSAEPTWAYLS